ncbi:hypothetical protein ABT297_12955 [Dactylosporangium sp. NPDC000555]|uniref:hypothetical protein n=1 Tax=Dactylosporangium sp. NPDC000555 TaxID=3154260 RepID=UPI00331DE216
MTPWWQAVDEAVESLVAVLTAAAARAGRRRLRGGPPPKGRAKSTRGQLAEVVRTHRLAPGVTVDRTTMAALFAGHRGLVTDPVLVVAVAQACAIVAGRKLTAREAARLRSASARIAELIALAEAADRAAVPSVPAGPAAAASPTTPAVPSAPSTPAASAPPAASQRPASQRPATTSGGPRRLPGRRTPVDATARPRGHGRRRRRRLAAAVAALIAAAGTLVAVPVALSGPSNTCQADDGVRTAPRGGRPVPMAPALDFDEVHGSVWRADQRGRTYYWATAGSAADRPASGGASVRWRFGTGGTWHDCAVTFPANARDDVPTAAVATVLAGRPVRLRVCLWRDHPFRQQCVAVDDPLPATSPGG